MFKKIVTLIAIGGIAAALASCAAPQAPTVEQEVKQTAKTSISDSALESNINKTIQSYYPSNVFPHRVNAVVWYGKTLLLGQTNSQELKDKILESVRGVYGVGEIIDRTQVNTNFNPTLSTEISDSAITTAIKSKLLVTKGIPSTKIKVITVNSEVYILSSASAAETNLAVEVAKTVSGIREISVLTP